MKLQEMYDKLHFMLSLATNNPEMDESELDRAIFQAVAVLSRFFPRELVAQTVYNVNVTAEAFTSASGAGTAVTLGNKPIKFGSESVTKTSDGTAYTRDTDYEMDYINGTITHLSGGSMSTSTAHLITYEMDGVLIDISSLLTEPINIERVDVLTHATVPSVLEGWSLFGDFLEISRGTGTQTIIPDNASIRVYYNAHHTEPTVNENGSWPRFLDEVLLIGASGYALMIESLQRMHQSVVDLATARTRLSSIAAVHTVVGTTITNLMTTEYTAIRASLASAKAEAALANIQIDLAPPAIILANAEFDAAKIQIAEAPAAIIEADAEFDGATIQLNLGPAAIVDGNTELDKVATEFALAKTALNLAVTNLTGIGAMQVSATDDANQAATELARVAAGGGSTALAAVELAKVTAIGALAAALTVKMEPLLTGADTSAEKLLDTVKTELDKGELALDKVDDEIDNGTLSAEKYLAVGDGLINAINVGEDAPGLNKRYADTKINMASVFVNEAIARVEHGKGLVSAANSYTNTAAQFGNAAALNLREAETRMRVTEGYHTQAAQYINSAIAYVQSSQAHIGTMQATIAEVKAGIDTGAGFVNEGAGYLALARGFQQEAEARAILGTGRTNNGNGHIAEARARLAAGDAYIANGRGYLAEAEGNLANASGYMATTRGYLEAAQFEIAENTAYIAQMRERISEMRVYLEEATTYQTSAVSEREAAKMFMDEAENRIASFLQVLSDRSQIMTHPVMTSVRQYANYQ
jgi:hypothetical protein